MSTPGPDVRVCFVGDSFVAGLGDSMGLGWVGRIAAESHRRGLPLTTYNLGVRRDTSVLISERLRREVAPRLAHAEIRRIVVSFGVNDTALENGAPRATSEQSIAALRRIHADANAMELMLVGPPAVDDGDQNDRISRLNEILREESRQLGIPFLPCFDGTLENAIWRREIREGDGFHPGAAGYEELATIIQEPVLKWLTPRTN
jgi:acyl-CoA thioesterase-1